MTVAQNLGSEMASEFRVGPLTLEGGAMLAPMSGVSDLGMRRAARRFGASLVFSEMVASETFLAGDEEACLRAEGEGLAPHAVQLVGREPAAMAEAAPRGGRRRNHRHQHGLSGPARRRGPRRVRADARSRCRRSAGRAGRGGG